MVGDVVEECYVSWHEAVLKQGMRRQVLGVAVRHVGRNTIEFERPRSGKLVRKRLTGRKLVCTTPDGRDLTKVWRET